MKIQIGKLGCDEGKTTGPEPGDGASSVGGFGDVEGTPSDALPDRPSDKVPAGRLSAAPRGPDQTAVP